MVTAIRQIQMKAVNKQRWICSFVAARKRKKRKRGKMILEIKI